MKIYRAIYLNNNTNVCQRYHRYSLQLIKKKKRESERRAKRIEFEKKIITHIIIKL